MTSNNLKKIEERLVPPAAPQPPEDLLERIQADIPDFLHAIEEPFAAPLPRWRFRLLAASVLLVVTGGVIGYRLALQVPSLGDRLDRQVPADEPAVAVAPPVEVIEPPVVQPATSAETSNAAAKRETNERAEIEVGKQQESARPDKLDRLAQNREQEQQPQPAASESKVVDDRSQATNEAPLVAEVGPSRGAAADKALLLPRDSAAASRPEQEEAGVRSQVTVGETPPPAEIGGRAMRLLDTPTAGRLRELERVPGLRAGHMVEPPLPSTGGTAEPNDAPYGDMFFRAYGTNPFVDTEDDPLSTFGLDVDTGSFTLARSYLDRGHLPPVEAIRVEEFINYFDYSDPAPRRGEFTVVAEGAPSPFASGPRYQLVRFGIKGREISRSERRPAVLIFVVDVSGSMQREGRLELVKRSLGLLLDQLDREDRIGLVVYGSRGEVLLEPTGDRDLIRRAIDRLVASGSTNAEEGLVLAYRQARAYYRQGAINRVILCSDGVANVGRTGAESILAQIRSAAEDGIELTAVGFGMGNYNDVLMEQLADQGDGSYAYVDTLEEAQRIFAENLTGTLQTIAADAKVQVEFDPRTVSRYRLLGHENRDIADERFRDDTVDAGEIGAGHTVTALYEVKLDENVGARELLATLRLRYRSKATEEIVEQAVELRSNHLASRWERSSTALRLSSLAAEFAEILKGSYWAKEADLGDLRRRLRRVADDLPGDEQVRELLTLVEQAERLSPPAPSYHEE